MEGTSDVQCHFNIVIQTPLCAPLKTKLDFTKHHLYSASTTHKH